MKLIDSLIPLPLCAKCNKDVDEIKFGSCFMTCRKVFIVKCHGEEEVTIISDQIVKNTKLEKGIAFSTKLLGSQQGIECQSQKRLNQSN